MRPGGIQSANYKDDCRTIEDKWDKTSKAGVTTLRNLYSLCKPGKCAFCDSVLCGTVLTQNPLTNCKVLLRSDVFVAKTKLRFSTRISQRNFHPMMEVPSPLYLVRRVFLELPSFASPILDISLWFSLAHSADSANKTNLRKTKKLVLHLNLNSLG